MEGCPQLKGHLPSLAILHLSQHTKSQPSSMPGSGLKVTVGGGGGWWVVVSNLRLVFSLGPKLNNYFLPTGIGLIDHTSLNYTRVQYYEVQLRSL